MKKKGGGGPGLLIFYMKIYVDETALQSLLESYATTENIDTINEEIENLKKSVSEGKALVANALTAKNVETSTTATFQEIADNITNNMRSADKYYRVQCGAYSTLAAAQTMKEQLEADGYSCFISYPTI